MSKIQAELVAATGITPKAGQDRQAFFVLLMAAVTKLTDAEWAALSVAAQDWYNDAADAKNAKKSPLPEMPDFVADEPKTTSRRRKTEPEPEPEVDTAATVDRDPEVGDTIDATTKRGKHYPNALVVEIGEDFVAIQPEGTTADEDQVEIATAGATFVVLAAEEEEGTDGEEGPFEPAVGIVVTVTNKRGKSTTGEIVELDEDIIVVKDEATGEEVEYAKDRIDTLVPIGEKPKAVETPKQEEPVTRARTRASSTADAEKAAKAEDKADAKGKRVTAGKISVGARVREIFADNLDVTLDELTKTLKKEGVDAREATIDILFKDCTQFIAALRNAKKLK